MKANKKILTWKIESGGYGVDASPAVGTNDIEVWNFGFTPVYQYAERAIVRPNFGAVESLVVGQYMQMEFDVPIAGSGAAATAPGYKSVLRACCWAETITPTTGPVTYSLISDSEESASVYFYWDGVRHKALGARGSVEFRFNESTPPVMHITLWALYGGIAVAALGGTPNLSAFKKPVAVNEANTAFSLHSYAGSSGISDDQPGCSARLQKQAEF